MKKLFYFSILFILTAFTCESDDALVEEEPLFPEAAAGEIVIEADGSLLVLNDQAEAYVSECNIVVFGLKQNPDDSNVSLNILLPNTAELTDYILEDYAANGEYCTVFRVGLSFADPADPDNSVYYSSFSNFGGSGILTITTFDFDPPSGGPYTISGHFEVIGADIEGSVTPIAFRGSFNTITINTTCSSPFC
ncbi:hypothetical protein [Gilvibacter sp.]|uniref:hypothetical protein n=1 Tax=Gilvibacter sp. TaxID=2729997 RepID=UPI003B5300DE